MIAIIVCSLGCGSVNNSTVANRSTELADGLTPPIQSSPAAIPSQTQNIYIDTSVSIGGFIGKTSSGNRTNFDEFIDAMPDVLPGCQVYEYGLSTAPNQPVKNVDEILTKAEFNAHLHEPSTYRRKFNPDDLLIQKIVSQTGPELSVILTDGVESDDRGQINTVLVNSIKSWLMQGKIFSILPLKSRFSGQYYSERQRKILGNATVEERPFYAFVFATSRSEYDDLFEKLRRRFASLTAFLFADDAIVSRIEMPDHELSGIYDYRTPPDKPYFWQMISTATLGKQVEDISRYKYLYEIKPSYPVKNLGFRLQSTLYRWDSSRGTFDRESGGPPVSVNLNESAASSTTEPNVQSFTSSSEGLLRPVDLGDYQFYSFQPSVYIKEVAEKVTELSTRDDSTIESANKTYRFQELVLAILDTHLRERLEARSSSRLYLTITSK